MCTLVRWDDTYRKSIQIFTETSLKYEPDLNYIQIPITRSLYSSAKYNENDQVMEDEMGRACSTNEAKRKACRILVGKPEGKRTLGRPRRRWVDNIKMDLREIGWGGMDWIYLAQDRDLLRTLMNTVMNFPVP
jgi:hypothetical protein